ncbi:MAG TPA: DUF4118 domain-containing protein [Pyrinomonadaceae bacterium]|nr:DUF4118 domain-containing protein [Pyrinomonadaceae bacterium]HNU08161.1 DUF4118 domain-containing protein [Pyrinomonadaceae bacterium]
MPIDPISSRSIIGYVVAGLGTIAVVFVVEPIQQYISITGVAFCLLLIVLLVATVWGSRPALLASIVAVLCFNYFFLPPTGTLTISDPENWVALAAFLVVALTAGQLSARLKERALQAEAANDQISRLYYELNEAFEKASHAEALKQSAKLKSALLDAVTHDIRTPLTSIKASVTTLLNDRDRNPADSILTTEMKRDMLLVINEEADRLDHFVEGMIELAKIESGELSVTARWDSVEEIVQAAVARIRSRLDKHRLIVSIDPDLPVIRVDARAVSEVLYSLIENAVKYSPDGTAIVVSSARLDSGHLVFTVEDEGPGIAPKDRDAIFEKFVRIPFRGRASPGTGLGLAIAKGIIEAHGGTISVTDGKIGAKFSFTLPIGDDQEYGNETTDPDR